MGITDLKWISWKINFCVINLLLMVLDTNSSAGIPKDYCTWEKFEAKCGLNEIIVMDAARYGRMRIGKCVKKTFGYLGCAANVLTHMDSVCSGRRECSMTVPDQTLRDMKPCSEIEAYLQASFSCRKVLQGSRSECNGKRQLKLTKSEGTIASTVAQQHGFGTRRCPWVITAKPGQRINVTLVDFGLAIRHADDDKASAYTSLVCQRYAHIKEDKMKGATVCGGERRVKNIYLSESHELSIEIIPRQSTENSAEFLLQYEVVGCAAPKVPEGAKWQRRGDTAYVTCNATGAKWELKCQGNKWQGKQGNCTDDSSWDIWNILSNDWSTPQGILLVTCLGIALGIIIGLILLSCALLCLKRKRAKQTRQPMETFIVGTETDGRHDSLCYNDSSVPLVNGNKIIRESEYQQYRCKLRGVPVSQGAGQVGVPVVETIMPTEKSDSGSSVGEFPPPPYPDNMSHPRTFATFQRGMDDHVYECAN